MHACHGGWTSITHRRKSIPVVRRIAHIALNEKSGFIPDGTVRMRCLWDANLKIEIVVSWTRPFVRPSLPVVCLLSVLPSSALQRKSQEKSTAHCPNLFFCFLSQNDVFTATSSGGPAATMGEASAAGAEVGESYPCPPLPPWLPDQHPQHALLGLGVWTVSTRISRRKTDIL